MGNLIEKIIDTENLHRAWKKIKNCFRTGDVWFDEIELTSFEANLSFNLEKIKNEIKSCSYILSPITPLPFPKGVDKINGTAKVRQTFDICVKDQVVWVAVVNIIGDSLDYSMPWWSYGHRLYIPVWKNKDERWEIGWYTHSRGQLYRSWNQSWPLFRRHISLTAKIMCRKKEISSTDDYAITLDDAENDIYNNNDVMPPHFKSKYLEPDYWKGRSADNLYWGTIDFKKFYPKVKRTIIVENILKYAANANEDEEFKILLTSLMDFKIDSDNWTKADLEDIGLVDPQNFSGLPTGLFVAGFLANVALLTVDKKISEDLNNNREIAHFRFVDDHVVLSYDFDELKKWIINYKQYLEEANTGVEFNLEKMEPESLSGIFGTEIITDEKKENIKNKCCLNPAFPAPLMTQTLAKVSAISRSDFEFLTQSEEERLISDLEHLLLTDFPDHELRKDTRISFAASILARIVPNTKEDYSKVYECQKRIQHKLEDYKENNKALNNNFITEKLHDLIFNNNIIEDVYFSKWEESVKKENLNNKEKIEAIKEIKKESENQRSLIKEINEQAEHKKLRVYKLLNKAIVENPEKVRIWTRTIDYCKKAGGRHIKMKAAYDNIDALTNQNIHELSAAYIRALFIGVLSDRLMQVVSSIINNSLISQEEKTKADYFINDVFSSEFLDNIFRSENAENKIYYLKTYEFFRFVLGTAIYVLNRAPDSIDDRKIIEKYNLIDWSNNPKEWVKKTHITDINAWLYWLLWKTHTKSSSKPLGFWKKLQPYINYSSVTYKALIIPFPNFNDIPRNDDKYLEFILNNGFDEGWLYEVFKTGKEKLTKNIKKKLKIVNPNLYNCIFSDTESLWDFIQWQQKELPQPSAKELDFFNNYFDVRFSEWTALELLGKIIDILESAEDFFTSKPEQKLHPANFIFPKTLMNTNKKFSWTEWKKEIKENKIKPTTFQISDERYTQKGLRECEQKKVHALGILLLQLVTHDSIFPWIWNDADKSMIFEHIFYSKIQNTPLSSYTLLILQACFSSKNREKFAGRKYFTDDKSDTSKDVPFINDVYTLKKYVNNAKSVLEKYQLSMENNTPRQLLPVSLEQFSILNNPFEIDNNRIE